MESMEEPAAELSAFVPGAPVGWVSQCNRIRMLSSLSVGASWLLAWMRMGACLQDRERSDCGCPQASQMLRRLWSSFGAVPQKTAALHTLLGM